MLIAKWPDPPEPAPWSPTRTDRPQAQLVERNRLVPQLSVTRPMQEQLPGRCAVKPRHLKLGARRYKDARENARGSSHWKSGT